MEILAVDDDPIIRDLIQTSLERARFCEVTVSSSASEALERLASSGTQFDCLLLDIEMPEMDGINLCRRIRCLEGYRYTPILMLTQRTDAKSIEQAFIAGATDYVTKPFDADDLWSRLRVADRMMKRAETVPRMSLREVARKGLPGSHEFEVEDPLYIENVPQLVIPFSLGTYLSQLSRSNLDICHVFAVAIDNYENIYANGSTREVAVAIVGAASAIAKGIEYSHLLMSHAGGGTLLCVVMNGDLPSWFEMESIFQKEIDAVDLCCDRGGKMKVALCVGKPIQPNASPTQRVKKTFDRAVDRLIRRQKETLDKQVAESRLVSTHR